VVGADKGLVKEGAFFLAITQAVFILSSLVFAQPTIINQVFVAALCYILLERIIFKEERSRKEQAYNLLKFIALYALVFGMTALIRTTAGLAASAAFFIVMLYLGTKYVVFRKQHIPQLFLSPWFYIPLAVKLVAMAIFSSDYLLRGVLPMVTAFASSLHNPYDLFLNTPVLQAAYPLSPILLGILAVPASLAMVFDVNVFGQIFLLKIPALIADVGILYLMHRLLKSKDKELLIFYWCSPIVFYVTYMQGQLDIIPISILLLSLYALITRRELLGIALLGIGIAAKANVVVAAPFIFLYLWRNRVPLWRLAAYAAGIAAVVLAFVLPLWHSPGLRAMMELAKEEMVRFVLNSPISFGEITIYLVPLLLLLFALRLSYYRIMGRDMLMMALAIAFMILVILVPPLSGWFLWSLPFIIYFFLKHESISDKHLYLYTAAYLLYFVVVNPASELLQVFQLIAPSIAQHASLAVLVSQYMSATILTHLAFTVLVATMIINSAWIYSHGIINRFEKLSAFFIGIAGDSGSGKSTTNGLIFDAIGKSNITALEGDDMHRWQRGDENWKKVTHLDPKANRLHEELRNARLIGRKSIMRSHYDHSTGRFTKPHEIKGGRFVLISGLHSLYLAEMRERIDLKIFMSNDPALQLHWKVQRDIGERGYTKERVLSQVKKREKDRKRHIEPQQQHADIVISYLPKKALTKKQVWDLRYNPELVLRITLKNSFDIEPVVQKLRETELKLKHAFNNDLETQSLFVYGRISNKVIEQLAHLLIPEIETITEHHQPRFHDGYRGITQLLVLYAINERMIMREANG
jgi:uridine kinase/Gpi18-like mannosyltransferase